MNPGSTQLQRIPNLERERGGDTGEFPVSSCASLHHFVLPAELFGSGPC